MHGFLESFPRIQCENFCSHTFVNAKWGWRYIGALQWGLIVVYKLVQLVSHRSWQDRCVSRPVFGISCTPAKRRPSFHSQPGNPPTHTHTHPRPTQGVNLQLSWQMTVYVTCLITLVWETCTSEWLSTQTLVGCVHPVSYLISSFYIQNTCIKLNKNL